MNEYPLLGGDRGGGGGEVEFRGWSSKWAVPGVAPTTRLNFFAYPHVSTFSNSFTSNAQLFNVITAQIPVPAISSVLSCSIILDHPKTMPPRKSNVSVGSNGAEEGGEGKASRDGLSVEVCGSHLVSLHDLMSLTGLKPTQVYDRPLVERSIASKHPNSQGCTAGTT